MTILKKNWFFVGIALMFGLAFALPGLGEVFREYRILNVAIFLAFFLTGLSLDTSTVKEQARQTKILFAAILSAHFLIPSLAFAFGNLLFPHHPDIVIGLIIIASAPVTVASGTVMTNVARGNVALSLFICVLSNFVGILIIPFTLKLFIGIGQYVELPVLQMLISLSLKVLLPTIIGQLLRPKVWPYLQPHKKYNSIFQQCVVLLIIFNATSKASGELLQAGPQLLLMVIASTVALHTIILVINFLIATKVIRLDLPSTAAFTIHVSQKTLTVSYLVWAGYFANQYPLGLIPPICYHLTQMIMDTFIADRFRKKALQVERNSAVDRDGKGNLKR
ncbi:bile acid:sodium symporter [Desulfopila inferna]|uniref:bile acid:sodium symporter n=1 Tax=Desulfopila inferna TaxID=468528 RepID=UPI001963C80A|nr:bile acid:sodium symporter [Desulfopila inferna]MBM9606422.1 bile acid:sodium symporter [Desulfopila inferna]